MKIVLILVLISHASYFGAVQFIENLPETQNEPFNYRPFVAGLSFVMLILGAWRVIYYHPRFNNNYLNWLRMMPWAGGPLPNGRVLLGIYDLIFLASSIFTVNLAGVHVNWAWIPASCYLVAICSFLQLTFLIKYVFITAFLFPVLMYCCRDFSHFFLIISVVTLIYQYLYLRDRKSCFPERTGLQDFFPHRHSPLWNYEFKI